MTFHHVVRGSGPPLLLMHGLPTNLRLWDLVVDRLADRRTCVAVDLPGFGKTPLLPDALRDPVPILAGLDAIRVELGFDAWEVAGHDAGATIAVHLLAENPELVTRLALMSPPIFPDMRPPWPFRWLRRPIIGDLAAPLALPILWGGGLRSVVEGKGEKVDEIVASFAEPYRGWAGARRFLDMERWGDPEKVLGITAALLPTIQVPTLVMRGERDNVIPAEYVPRTVALVPRAEGHVLDGGHFLPLDVPDRVAELLAGG